MISSNINVFLNFQKAGCFILNLQQTSEHKTKDANEKNQPANNDTKTQHSTQNQEPRDIDILNLPPRSEVHKKDGLGFHFKINHSLLRLLIVILLLVVLILGVVVLQDGGIMDVLSIFKT